MTNVSPNGRNYLNDMVARNFQLMSTVNDRFWELWMVNLGSVSWLNEQWETMTQTYLGQRKNTRDEFVKVAEQMAAQLRKNLEQVEDMIKEASLASAESVNMPGFMSYTDLVKKVDDLSKKMDSAN